MTRAELIAENDQLKKLVEIGQSMAGLMYNFDHGKSTDASPNLRALMKHWREKWDRTVNHDET